MILCKEDYRMYLEQDMKANWRSSAKPKLFGDEQWKFILTLRKLEYYRSKHGFEKIIFLIPTAIVKFFNHRYAVSCGYTINAGQCGKGLALPHRGYVVMNSNAVIGDNCRIHQGVTIGSTGGSDASAKIGNNVFIGAGASIIGDIEIADDVSIGANAVVTKSCNPETNLSKPFGKSVNNI